jgi:hypothetical protein
MNIRGVIVPALVVFVAVVWWASRSGGVPPLADAPAANPERSQAAGNGAAMGSARAESQVHEDSIAQAAAQSAEEGSLGSYTDGKYQFLFDGPGQSPEAAARLREALLAREKLAVDINTAKQSSDPAAREAMPGKLAQLAELDQKMGTLLRPGDLATFEVLKDSDIEQFQLDDYAGGVSAVAPLSDADRKAILYTKLVHRQRFRQVLTDTGLMRGDLSASERQMAFAEVSRSLRASRDSYLQEVRQYLYEDAQFILLSNYENTEYAAELEKLRGIANGE